MPYVPLTESQFNKARAAGFSLDQIIKNEKTRKASYNPFNPNNKNGQYVQPGQDAAAPGTTKSIMGNLFGNKQTTGTPSVIGQGLEDYGKNVGNDYMQMTKNLGSDISQTAQDLKTNPADKHNLFGSIKDAGKVAGDIIKVPADAIGGIFSPITEIAKPTVQKIGEKISNNSIFQKINNSNAVTKAKSGISNILQKHPTISKDINSAINIGGSLIGEEGVNASPDVVNSGLDTAKSSINETVDNIKSVAGDKADVKATQDTWDMIKPKKPDASSLEPKGIFGKVTQVPDVNDQAMIEAAKPYVTGAKDGFEARTNMQQGIAEQANALQKGLKDTKAIYSGTQVQGALDKIEADPQLVGDSEKIYDKIRTKMMTYVGKGGTLDELLGARKNFDAYINKYFPNLYSSERMTAIKTGVLDIRKAVNDFIASKLPDGNLPDGTSFKQSLQNQSMLYDAIDNVEDKLPKEGEATTKLGKASQFLKKNKKAIAISTATALGGGAIAKHLP